MSIGKDFRLPLEGVLTGQLTSEEAVESNSDLSADQVLSA